MYKRKKSYIKEIVDAIVSIEFPDWEECSPLIRKTGDKTKHKVLLAQLLEAIMLENKYLHNSGIPFHYSFDKQDVLDVIFRDRKNEIDPNDPLKRKYRETDPRNEEGTERLFDIIYTANKKKKITNTYILKHQYRPYFVIGKSINSITYYNDNGTRQEVPKYALPEKIRKEIGSDISTKIYVNLGAIAVAKIEIDKIIEASNTYTYLNKDKILGVIKSFLREELKDSKEIKTYDLCIKRLEEHSISLKGISMYATANDNDSPFIYHQYKEETSKNDGNGRLWNSIEASNTFNIQNISKVIRNIILTDMGYVEYDINNCHINILSQYYKMVFGQTKKELEYFCNNYKIIRNTIVSESGVSYKLVKEAMIGLAYGGSILSEKQIMNLKKETLEKFKIWNKFKEYYTTDGVAKNKIYNLYSSKTFIKFIETIKETTKELEVKSKKGIPIYGEYIDGYINPCWMLLKETDKEKESNRLSHLFQGIEALSLRVIIRDDPDSIVSLHHDGWIGRTKKYRETNDDINTYLKQLKERVYRETKKKMIEWNNRIGKPLPHPDGFNFDFSYQRLEGMENIKCKANIQKQNPHIRQE
jgi:hypothetical protein